MSATRTLVMKALVRPYYRQNTSLFLFLILLVSVSTLTAAYPYDYHYRLILGILQVKLLFLLVLAAWFICMTECTAFIIRLLHNRDHDFLNMLYLAGPVKSFLLLLRALCWISLPISVYAIAVIGVALYKHWYMKAFLVAAYILLLCLANAGWCLYHIQHPGKKTLNRIPLQRRLLTYQSIFIRYILSERKLLFLGIKLFSCGALYLLLKDIDPNGDDLRMATLFYSFGLFAHGILIYRFRELEENKLTFYRGLPVSLPGRFAQYALLYLLLFIPEMIILIRLTIRYLHVADAILLAANGYTLLLLLNTILFAGALKMGEFVKLIFAIFLLQYGFVLAGGLAWLTGLLFIAAPGIFYWGYYRFEIER